MGNWQDFHTLTNLTHLDGRNAVKLFSLRPYFSELAWMKERFFVLASHLIALAPVIDKPMHRRDTEHLLSVAAKFTLVDGKKVMLLEKTLNHDLKALEVYLSAKLPKSLKRLQKYLLFGLGSEDINSVALARLLKRSRGEVLLPEMYTLIRRLAVLADQEKNTEMIARTHGLPAGVTTLGKELANPLSRLCDEIYEFSSVPFQAKLVGEVGSLHALGRTVLNVDWLSFGDRFVRSMGVEPYHASTQIAPYDKVIRYLHSLFRINSILIDLCKNMWLYVLLGYVRVVKKEKEVGSSGMPHKVNPIYFEGAEGGLAMANGLIETLARTLMGNRLQRDFSDSTIRRNIPMILAYSLLSYQSMTQAFDRIEVRGAEIAADLSRHAEVWIEPIKLQMILGGYDDAFALLKRKTRGNSYTFEELESLVATLPIDEAGRKQIRLFIKGKKRNPYPARIVGEVVTRAKKLTSV